MHASEVREKDIEDAAGCDVGNLGIKIAGLALAQPELLLHFFGQADFVMDLSEFRRTRHAMLKTGFVMDQ